MISNFPVLSIITPVFNGASFVLSALENVTQQDCGSIEHIVIDGGSDDGTSHIISEYASAHAHVRWLSEPDRGQSHAMNKGIGMANGRVLSFLNVDDYYEPGALKYVINRFENLPEMSMLIGECKIWNNTGTMEMNRPFLTSHLNILAGRALPMNPSAYFYDKKIHDTVGLYNVDDHYSMDVDFLLRATKTTNIVYDPVVLGNFRFVPGTKTFEDVQSGTNGVRLRSLYDTYIEQLSWNDRMYVRFFTDIWNPLRYNPRSLIRYAKEPRLFIDLLQRKFNRFF